jgi:hypothetical protein
MAGGIYSHRFIAAAGAGPWDYFVPPGKVAVVKMISIVNASTSTTQAAAYVAGILVWIASVPGNAGSNNPGLMMVAYAGEAFRLAGSFSTDRLAAFGYLLDGTPAGAHTPLDVPGEDVPLPTWGDDPPRL